MLQVPKSYKAPVFLEQLVAGLSDQGTVSLECKVLVVTMMMIINILGLYLCHYCSILCLNDTG